MLQLTDLKNDQIFEIIQFEKLTNFLTLTLKKKHLMLQFGKFKNNFTILFFNLKNY